MNVNTNKKVSFYTPGQRFAARVLFIVWLLVSCSPAGALADQHQGFPGLAKMVRLAFVGTLLFFRPGSSEEISVRCILEDSDSSRICPTLERRSLLRDRKHPKGTVDQEPNDEGLTEEEEKVISEEQRLKELKQEIKAKNPDLPRRKVNKRAEKQLQRELAEEQGEEPPPPPPALPSSEAMSLPKEEKKKKREKRRAKRNQAAQTEESVPPSPVSVEPPAAEPENSTPPPDVVPPPPQKLPPPPPVQPSSPEVMPLPVEPPTAEEAPTPPPPPEDVPPPPPPPPPVSPPPPEASSINSEVYALISKPEEELNKASCDDSLRKIEDVIAEKFNATFFQKNVSSSTVSLTYDFSQIAKLFDLWFQSLDFDEKYSSIPYWSVKTAVHIILCLPKDEDYKNNYIRLAIINGKLNKLYKFKMDDLSYALEKAMSQLELIELDLQGNNEDLTPKFLQPIIDTLSKKIDNEKNLNFTLNLQRNNIWELIFLQPLVDKLKDNSKKINFTLNLRYNPICDDQYDDFCADRNYDLYKTLGAIPGVSIECLSGLPDNAVLPCEGQ